MPYEPQQGDIRCGKDIGKNQHYYYIWGPCPRCQRFRWSSVQNVTTVAPDKPWADLREAKARRLAVFKRCSACAGGQREAVPLQPYERRKTKDGYVYIAIPQDDPAFCWFTRTTTKKMIQVAEHRWVMAKRLGRPLLRGELVHHVDGVRHHNKIENLEIWVNGHPYGQSLRDVVIAYLRDLSEEARQQLLSEV